MTLLNALIVIEVHHEEPISVATAGRHAVPRYYREIDDTAVAITELVKNSAIWESGCPLLLA